MASATGIPARAVDPQERGEDEPLLGRPGDVLQENRQPLYYNIFTGKLGEGMYFHRRNPLTHLQALPLLPRQALYYYSLLSGRASS